MTLTPSQNAVSSATEPGNAHPGLGAALRRLRRARRLSLSQVAEATLISASFLSLVENGKSDITIGRLVRLVDFYGVSIVDLLPSADPADSEIVRASEGRKLRSPAEGIDIYLLTPDTRRSMMPMLLVFEPGAALAEHGRHEGEEFVQVLEGRLELDIAGSEPRLLAQGDSAYYPADRPHLFRNADARKPLRVLCVDTPPNL